MSNTIRRLNNNITHSNVYRIPFITILIIFVAVIVELTGGVPNAFVHLIYIPIFLSAYYWGILGGTSVAIIGGILISPLIKGIFGISIQSEDSYMIRLIILTAVGFVSGYIFNRIEKLNKQAKLNDVLNPLTGTYNINKLIKDLEERMGNGEKFAVVSIKLTNIEQVSKYLEQKLADGIISKLISELSSLYGNHAIYMSGNDEINFIVALGGGYLEECKRIIFHYSSPLKVNKFTLRILMKVGIYEYAGISETPIDVYNKARIAYEQGGDQDTGLYLYDKGFDLSRKEFFEISNSLLEAINENELYLVYQPKIDITNTAITGVEVLTRWNRKEKKPVAPNVFIKLAEDIGFIKEISKFVLDHSFHQILDWNAKGIVLDFSINFTANELLENHFTEWERRVTESEHIIMSKLEIEITERVLSQNFYKMVERIKELRAKGIKISIDDYGTGVNSLYMTTQLPYDQIKIDRYFISHIDDYEIRELIRDMIEHAHKFGREVVAEGVETEEQINILKELNCDIAQGYYFSKPLRPCEFEQYYLEFSRRN